MQDRLVVALIITNAFITAYTYPGLEDDNHDLYRVFERTDNAFTICFVLEASLKVVAFGFISVP